jgi:hypothetical protein
MSRPHTVKLDEDEADALRAAAIERGESAHATHRALLREGLVVRQPQAAPLQPQFAPPQPQTAAPQAPASIGGVADLAQLAALLRAMQPPPQDMTPVLVALAQANRGPDLAGLAALMQSLRPEPAPSPWPAILGAVLPAAAPVLETYLQARADSAGAQTLGGVLAQVGAVIAGKFADEDEAGDDDEDEAPTQGATP